jgi:hypothetical protein
MKRLNPDNNSFQQQQQFQLGELQFPETGILHHLADLSITLLLHRTFLAKPVFCPLPSDLPVNGLF